MNRTIKPALTVLAIALVAAPVAEAGAVRKSRPRVVRESYAPNPYEGISISFGNPGASITSVPVPLRADEHLVSVKLRDESGSLVAGTVYQRDSVAVRFCGETDEPVAVDPSKDLDIEVTVAPCYGDVSIPTEGTVEVKIYSR